MTLPPTSPRGLGEGVCFALRFQSLIAADNDLSFACNAQGVVDMNALSPKERENYLFARALVGRSFSPPQCVEYVAL